MKRVCRQMSALTRERTGAELARWSREDMRNALEVCGYSPATASAAADVFTQVIETVRQGRPAEPLSGD